MDFVDLIRIGKEDPKKLQSIVQDQKEISKFELTSAELETLKKLDPNQIKAIVEGIDKNIAKTKLKDSNGCSGGTNGCHAAELMKGASPGTPISK